MTPDEKSQSDNANDADANGTDGGEDWGVRDVSEAKTASRSHGGRPIRGDTRLARAIARRGIPQYQVAAQCELSPRTLSYYCTGRKPIRVWHLLPLARLLRVPPKALIEDEDWGYYGEQGDVIRGIGEVTDTMMGQLKEKMGETPVNRRGHEM